jgi:hypothetical protein
VVAKPLSGAMTSVKEFTRGLQNVTGTAEVELQRYRVPRPFVHGHVLKDYDAAWAMQCAQVRKMPSWPRSWANFSLL